jgi:hypothetical protein
MKVIGIIVSEMNDCKDIQQYEPNIVLLPGFQKGKDIKAS